MKFSSDNDTPDEEVVEEGAEATAQVEEVPAKKQAEPADRVSWVRDPDTGRLVRGTSDD